MNQTSRPSKGNSLLADLNLSEPVPLRLLFVDHPSLPKLTPQHVTRLIDLVEENTKAFVGAQLSIESQDRIPLHELFRRYLAESDRKELERWMIPHDHEGATKAVIKALSDSSMDVPPDQMHRIVRGHPMFDTEGPPPSREDIFRRVAHYQVRILRSLYSETLPDGTPLVISPILAQAKAWETLATNQDRADLIIIPNLIASAESGMTLPEALRGGISAGLVAPHSGPLQGVAVFSSYPFLGKDSVLCRMRGAPPTDPVRVMSLYLLHELGHLLKRWAHAWEHPDGCLMLPSRTLDYQQWFHNVTRHGPCRLPHPRMKTF